LHCQARLTPSPSPSGRGGEVFVQLCFACRCSIKRALTPSPSPKGRGGRGVRSALFRLSLQRQARPHPQPLSQGERGEKCSFRFVSLVVAAPSAPSPPTPLPMGEGGNMLLLPSPSGRGAGGEGIRKLSNELIVPLTQPNATSSVIITAKPIIVATVARSVFFANCDSGINSSTTT